MFMLVLLVKNIYLTIPDNAKTKGEINKRIELGAYSSFPDCKKYKITPNKAIDMMTVNKL